MAIEKTLGFSSIVFRKKFRSGMSARSYRDNEIIFSQGDKADAVFFYIQSGTVKLTIAATRRKKAIIAVLLRGSFFGEGCLGGQSLRSVYGAINWALQHHSLAEGEHASHAQARRTVCSVA